MSSEIPAALYKVLLPLDRVLVRAPARAPAPAAALALALALVLAAVLASCHLRPLSRKALFTLRDSAEHRRMSLVA